MCCLQVRLKYDNLPAPATSTSTKSSGSGVNQVSRRVTYKLHLITLKTFHTAHHPYLFELIT